MTWDTNGDGVVDISGLDTNSDSIVDTYVVDNNEDGIAESVALDTNGDGMTDYVVLDSNEDGQAEAYGADLDGDGYLETVQEISQPAELDWSFHAPELSGFGPAGIGSPNASSVPGSQLGSGDVDHDGIPDAQDSRDQINDTKDSDFDGVPDADDHDPLDPLSH